MWLLTIIKYVPPQLSQYADVVMRVMTGLPARFRSQITPNLFLGGQYTAKGLRMLKKWGITGIISLRSDPPNDSFPLDQFHHLHLPTPDRQAPTMAQLKEGVAFIEQEIEANGKVYIHCLFGQGRGPTMVMAYLMSQGMKLKDALAKIQAVRPFASPSREQMRRLKKYRKMLKKMKA